MLQAILSRITAAGGTPAPAPAETPSQCARRLLASDFDWRSLDAWRWTFGTKAWRELATRLVAENDNLRQALAERRRLLAERDQRLAAFEVERRELQRKLRRAGADLAQVAATRDRYQLNGKRNKAERLEVEAVLRLPGVERALVRAVHPNAHPTASAAEQRVFHEGFIALRAIYERLGCEGGSW